ncbi:MAG: MBL fold metallo-hydrolase [Planctomycetota bacterium]|nr:MAG: MBL fold metallo-hydrolase [Planctomycetota bacterium]
MSEALDRALNSHLGVAAERQSVLERRVGERELRYDPDEGVLEGEDLRLAAWPLAVRSEGGLRWAWGADSGWPAASLRAAESLRRLAVEHGLDELLEPVVPTERLSERAASLLAVGLSDADGVLCVPHGGQETLFLVRDREGPERSKFADPALLQRSFENLAREVPLPDPRAAFAQTLAARGFSVREEEGAVVGLAVDGQRLVGRFDGAGRLLSLERETTPPAEGARLDGLSWEQNPEGGWRLRLGALGVGLFGRLLARRALAGESFRVRGERGLELCVEPGPPAVAVEGKGMLLRLDEETAREMLSLLRPRCGEVRVPGLSDLVLEVVPSEQTDADGKALRTLGWEPLPTPDWAIEPEALAAEREARAHARARRRRRLRWACVAALLLSPFCVVAFAVFALRHRPYRIPAAFAAPPPGVGLALGRGLRLRYLGVSGYELTDGKTVLLLDPVLTRPTLLELLSGPIDSDPQLVQRIRRADYILINHAHHDHAIDAPAIARRTGATVVGSPSVLNLCRSRGVPESQLLLASPGRRLRLGTFVCDVRATKHSAILGIENPMAGTVPPDAGPLWFFQYTNDGGRAYRLTGGGTTLWWHVSSHYEPGGMDLPATNLIFGFAGEPMTADKARALVADVGPRRVFPTHYDNFFQPRERGLGLLPTVDVEEGIALLRAADPSLDVWLLDYDQAVELPPDD